MALPQSAYKDRQFIAVIGDEVRTSGQSLHFRLQLKLDVGLSDRDPARGRRRMFSSSHHVHGKDVGHRS